MSEAAADGGPLRELEQRFELETAVLVDRLECQAEELERLHLELAQTRDEREQARGQLAGVAAELDELTLQLALSNAIQRDVFASASWRLTRPLRWAKRVGARR
jgi:hypothetical protein